MSFESNGIGFALHGTNRKYHQRFDPDPTITPYT